jgi:uncharacterized membrane protein
MVKRIAREWLWLLGAVFAALCLSLISHGAFWRVGVTGIALVSLYGLSVVIRTTMWAVRNARSTAGA